MLNFKSKIMSYGQTTLNPCENLQVNLNQRWEMCEDTARVMEPMPFFDFVASDRNRQGVAMEVAPGGGKIRTVNVRYDQRINEDNVQENQTHPNCVETTKRGDSIATYEIDTEENLTIGELMTPSDFAAACRDNGEILARKIELMMDVLDRRVATKTTEQAVLLAGGWGADVTVNGNDELEVRTIRSGATDELYPFTMEEIDMALAQSAFCNQVGIFGGTTLWQYMRRMEAGCCATQGVDLGEIMDQYGKVFGWDRRVATALGGNEFNFAVQLGALQLITYNLFEGPEGFNQITTGSNYQRMVVVSPRTGIPYDFIWSDSCGNISVNLTATTKLIAMPDDLFGTGDIFAGVNFFNKIKVVNS